MAMNTRSLRQSVREALGPAAEARLREGLWKALGQPLYAEHPSAFPYGLSSWIASLAWPKRLISLDDHPSDRSVRWGQKLQGVTHDDKRWYISQKEHLLRVPVEADLNENRPFDWSIPDYLVDRGAAHVGAIDHHAGKIYVPLEGTTPATLLVLDAATFAVVGEAPLTPQGQEAPWCAVHPRTGLVYSSAFYDEPAAIVVHVYEPIWSGGRMVRCDPVGQLHLRTRGGGELIHLNRIQGGTFSPQGHLYLVADKRDLGLHGFDSATGCLMFNQAVDYRPGLPYCEELQGLTIWDLDDGRAPLIRGQLHLMMLDQDPVGDEVYFKHYGVDAEDRDRI